MNQDLTAIDTKHLQELYGEDKEILSIIFESFLEDSLQIWKEVGHLIDIENFSEAGQKIHQIKPNFSMVGLTSIYPLIQEFEKDVKNHPDTGTEYLRTKYTELDLMVTAGGEQIRIRMESL